jgi:benzoyl-CoA reductase subunit C
VAIPCPTRVQHDVDWDGYLLGKLTESDSEGLIVLMAKFCEPHMLYYPELKKALDERGVPHLIIETEHEGIPVESIRTRVESMLERIRRNQLVGA